MRIAIQSFFDAMEGGAELHTVMLADHLVRRDHEVIFYGDIPESFSEKLTRRGIDLTGIRQESQLLPNTILEWRRRLSENDVDCWVVPKGGIGSGSLKMELAAKVFGGHLLTIEHSLPPEMTQPKRLFGRMPIYGVWRVRKRLTYDSRSWFPKSIVAVSAATATRLKRDYGYPESKVQFVRNGVNTERFVFDAEQREQIRQSLGIPRDAIVIGSIGRLVSNKAFRAAIETFGKLRSKHVEIDPWLVIYGQGPLRKELEEQIDQLGLSERVLLPGDTLEPWRIYPCFDVFLMSSKFEGLPLSLLEAMASRCVPVCYSVGGIPEVIRHGKDGLLVEPQNVEALEAAIESLLVMPAEQRRSIGRIAEARVVETFDEKKQMERICDLIEATGRRG